MQVYIIIHTAVNVLEQSNVIVQMIHGQTDRWLQ